MRFKVWLILAIVFGFNSQWSFCSGNGLEVTFSSKRGFYEQPFSLTLTSSDPTAVIRYTTDCSLPSMANGNTYGTEMAIASTTVVKAIAYSVTDTSVLKTHTYLFPEGIKNQGKNPAGYPVTWGGSSTINADYEMDPEIINNTLYSSKITDALKSLPALCLSMSIDDWFDPNTGNYVGYPNSNVSREKPVSAEFIYAGTTESFDVNCGVQNQGGTSIINWKVPKQSMRLLFKDEYGPKKLKKKLFPDSDINSINTLVVDAFLYSWVHSFDRKQRVTSLYFRDQLCSDLQNAMGRTSFHGIYVNLFINGLYWGVCDLHERPDEDFMEEYYDADKTNFDIIKHNPGTVVAGSNVSYMNLLNLARKGFSTPGSLDEIQKYLDLPAFIDYMVLNFYLGNYDWAHQNYYAATNNVLSTGYQFYTWDAEHVMRYSDVDYDATKKNDIGGPTEIHSLLKDNSEYRMMFADAFYKHAFNNGALSIENFEKKFMYRKDEIDLAIILESARWGDYRENVDGIAYTRNDHWVPEVDKVLTDYIPNRRDIVIEQLQRSDNFLYPRTAPPVFSITGGTVEAGEAIQIKNTNPGTNTIVYTTDGSDPRKPGGAVGGTVYTSAVTINSSMFIKARILNSTTKEWSPLAVAYYTPENVLDNLMITEMMYHSGYNGIEFIELMNSGTTDIDLIGLSFIDGIDYTFGQSTILSSGESIVLTNKMELFEVIYKFKAHDVYNKNLSNKGEIVVLADYYGHTIDSVNYTDTIPWPVYADGYGRSMELISPDLDNSLPSSWKASDETGGTPVEFISNILTPIIASAQIYPNPATDMVNIVLHDQNLNNGGLFVEIYNNLGQLVKKDGFNPGPNMQVNIHGLEAGIYFLRIVDHGGALKIETIKLLKQDN